MRWTIAGIVVVLGACSAPSDDAAGGDLPTWIIEPTPEVTIGEVDGPPETLFQQITEVRLFDDGRIVVADREANFIRVFQPDGSFAVEIGGPGDGPSEFRFLVGVQVAEPDTLIAWDADLNRFSTFDAAGTLLGNAVLEPRGSSPSEFIGRFANGDYVVSGFIPEGLSDPANRVVSPDSMDLARYRTDGSFDRQLRRVTGMIRDLQPLPFSPFLHAFVRENRVLHADGMLPEVAVLDDLGAPVGSIPVPLPTEDPHEARARFDAVFASAELSEGMAQMLGDWLPTVSPDHPLPHFAELLLDDSGHLWAKKYDPESDSWIMRFLERGPGAALGGEWFVVAPQGGFVATVVVPPGLMPMDVRGDRIVGVTVDPLGVQRVAVHRIRR